jgi:DNA mismatch repair ATPase MutS
MYTQIMGKMWNISWDMSPQKMLQNAFTLFTLAQSMYQPIQNALHLYTIHSSIKNLGTTIYGFKHCIDEFRTILEKNSIKYSISKSLEDLPDFSDTHRCFIEILEQPFKLHLVSKDLAKLEVLWKIAQNNEFQKTEFRESETPYFKSDYIVDINLNKESRVPSSLIIDETKHFLLSGPNGGGKSSFLRGTLQTILLSQTFGYSIGKNVYMSVFDQIFSGLHIIDNPGAQSLFEKEIIFARDVLYHNNPKLKAFVVFDEIFHSTNPPDGIKTSQRFLNKLWSYNHMCSIISTHVFDIIEESPEYIKKICVKAIKEGDTLKYDYRISEGICKESSVEKIWKIEWDSISAV